MQPGSPRVCPALACAVGALLAVGCAERPKGVDLLRAAPVRLAEASAAGEDAQAVRDEVGQPQRIRNVVRASLPASPPSRYRFVTDVPRQGKLVLDAGIPGRHHGASAVEFLVHVRDRGRETTVVSKLLDPANRPAHRQWVKLEADLSAYARPGVEIVLETRGYEETGTPGRAFWGTPTITVAEDSPHPLVIVYLVDTLRADHLPLYGYSRDTAPELSRFAADAVVFDQAIAPSSWTKPSVASLFTSLLPRDHGCVQFYTPLDPGLVTLAERMRDHGYTTGAVVANPLVLAKNMHFDQGFSYFAAPAAPQRAGQVVDAALAFLDARKGLPTFLYVHTMDAHTPYQPPPPFDRKFGPRPQPGRAAAEPSDYRVPRDLDRIVGQYDGAVAYGDREFGRLLQGLRRARPLRSGAGRLPLRPRGGVPRPRRLGPRPHPLRRAGARAARREVPGAARGGTARGGPGPAPRRPADDPEEPGPARPCRCRRARPRGELRRGGARARGGAGDEVPRARRVRGPLRPGQVRAAPPPGAQRDGDRPPAGPAGETPPRARVEHSRPGAEAGRRGVGVPRGLPPPGARRRGHALRAAPADDRLDRGRRAGGPGLRPSARRSPPTGRCSS